MIVHAKVFETKYRTLMAEHTLPYQSNYNLDYEFIAQKCDKVIREMEEFDGKLHQRRSDLVEGALRNAHTQGVRRHLDRDSLHPRRELHLRPRRDRFRRVRGAAHLPAD